MTKKSITISIILILAIVLIIVLSLSSDTAQAQATLNKAISNQYELESLSYLGEFTLSIKDEKKLKAEIRGDAINLQDPENVMMQFNIDALDEGALGFGENAELKASLIVIGEILYLRLDSLSAENLPFDLSSITKQWIKIEDIEEKTAGIGASSQSGLNPLSTELSKEQLAQLRQFVKESNVLKVVEDFGIQDEAYHLAYKVDLKAALDLAQKISEFLGEELDQEEIQLAKEELRKLKGAVTPRGELWINQHTEYLERITLYADLPETTEIPYPVKASLDMQMLNFNSNDLEIAEPDESIAFEEAFAIVMQAIFSPTLLQAVE